MKNVRVLTEGAIIAALFTIIAMIAFFVPFLGTFVLWILPIPFIVFSVRNGWKPSLVVWVVASFVSFLVGGLLLITLSVMFGSGGIVVGELIRRKKSALTVLVGGSLAYTFNLLGNFVFSIVVFSLHPIEVIQEVMYQSVESAEAMLLAIGQVPGQELAAMLDFVDRLMYLTPSLLIITGVAYALIIQVIATAVLRRIGIDVQRFLPFREWTFPKSFLWYYLIASIFVIMGLEEGTTLYLVFWNLFPLLEVVMTIQGLAVIFYFFYIKQVHKSIAIGMVIIIVVAPFLLYLYRIIGIIDLGFDLRKRMK